MSLSGGRERADLQEQIAREMGKKDEKEEQSKLGEVHIDLL